MPPALVQTNAWSSRWLISENPATCPSSFIAVAALSKPPASVPKSVTVYDCAPASGTRIKAIAAHRPKLTLPIVQSSVKPIRTTVTMLRVIWTLVKMKVLAQREAYSFGRQVTLSGVSDNVGCVKQFSSTLQHALVEERHFALAEAVAFAPPTQARSQSVFRSGTQSDPCISSVTTSIMITTSNSSVKRSGIPTQLLDVLLHTIACSGLSRVRTELC